MVAKFIVKNDASIYSDYHAGKSKKMISASHGHSKRLTSASKHDHNFDGMKPEDVIKLDEDEFGRY